MEPISGIGSAEAPAVQATRKARSCNLRAGIVALALPVMLCLSATPSHALEKVVFGVPTTTSVSFSTYFTAMKAGFLKDEGIDLEILNFRGASIVGSLLLSGRLTIAWQNPAWLIEALQPGKDPAPVKFFYNQNRTTVWEYVVPESSPIKSFRDLKGKTLGMPNLGSGTLPITRSMLKYFGLKNSDYQVAPVGQGMPAFRALLSNRVQILGTIVPIRARMSASGMKLRILKMPPKYATLPSLGFAATLQTFKNKPKILVGFARAVAKATIFCRANLKACVEAYWAERPDAAPSPAKRAKVLAIDEQILDQYIHLQMRLPGGDESVLGQYNDRIWREYINILHETGQIKKTDIPLNRLYTNKYILTINDFDAENIRARARAWKGWN